MARVTQVGRQTLAVLPDAQIGRVTQVGRQILAETPPAPVHVSNSAVEVLVVGEPSPDVRVTQVGRQFLVDVPPPDVRVSNSAIEALVVGESSPNVRVTQVGRQVLMTVPTGLRVSNSVLEVLVAVNQTFSPGKLHGARVDVSARASYPSYDQPLSDLEVSHLEQTVVSKIDYPYEGADYRLKQLALSVSVPSSILTAPVDGRLFQASGAATVASEYLPPSVPQSDLYVSALVESLAVTTAVPEYGSDLDVTSLAQLTASPEVYEETPSNVYASSLAQLTASPEAYEETPSNVTVSAVNQQVADGADYLDKDLPQSDLWVTQAYQDVATAGEYLDKSVVQSDLWVTQQYQDVATAGEYLDKDLPQSDLYVDAVAELTGHASSYPDPSTIIPDKRLHLMAASATVPATWLDSQKTQLRTHFQSVQLTYDRAYPPPATITPPTEVSYLTEMVASGTAENLGDPSNVYVNSVIEQAGSAATYPAADKPVTEVTVEAMALQVVRADDSFEPLTDNSVQTYPIVSIALIYE